MPAPNRRNKGASLADRIADHAAARGVTDVGDRFIATRTRQDKRWEEAAARLSRGSSDLEQRAEQARTDYTRAKRFEHFEADVRAGRAKPPIVVLIPNAPPRYYLGECLDCSVELWVHKPKPRVPICRGCHDRREQKKVDGRVA